MRHAVIDAAFTISTLLAGAVGIAVLIWWARQIHRRVAESIEARRRRLGHVDVEHAAMTTSIRMLPRIALLLLVFTPAFDSGWLRKQHAYCVELIRGSAPP